MFLNQTYQYALRAMSGLTVHEEEGLLSTGVLSELTGVPGHYLSKIMRKMVEAGFVESKKGHHGGFRLKANPSEIKIMDILVAAGFDADAQPCVFGWKVCSNDNPCPMHPAWKYLKNCFNDWACNTTLAYIKSEYEKTGKVKSL